MKKKIDKKNELIRLKKELEKIYKIQIKMSDVKNFKNKIQYGKFYLKKVKKKNDKI